MSRETPDPNRAANTRIPRPTSISASERWIVRGLLLAAVGLVAASLAMTVGRDGWNLLRRRWTTAAKPISDSAPQVRRDLPPLPELGLPPPVIPASPPAAPLPVPHSPQLSVAAPVDDVAPAVVTEPVLDGHMIEPERFDASSVADEAAPSIVDDIFLETESGLAEASGQEFAWKLDWLRTAPARDRIKYASALKRVIRGLIEGDARDQRQVDESFQEARRIFADDPRLSLAHGLYLLQIGETKTARERLEECAAREGARYVPSHFAAALCRLQSNDLRRAWPHLLRLAGLAAEPSTDGVPSEFHRRFAAEWLGAAAAYLESLSDDRDGRHLVDVPALRDPLPSSLQTLFDGRYHEAQQRLAELGQWAELTPNEAAQRLSEVLAKLENQHEASRAECQSLWAALHDDTAELRDASEAERKARGELNLTLRQRRLAQEAVAQLSQPRTYSYTQTTYQYQTDAQGRRQRVPVTVVRERAENSSERAARLAQLQEASAALTKIDLALPDLKQKHEQARAVHEQLAKGVRDKTAQNRSRLAMAEKQRSHAERLLSMLRQFSAEPDRLTERLRSPTLLLDWNLADIGERLKASLEPLSKPSATVDALPADKGVEVRPPQTSEP
jgi:hypothetical protein